MLIAKEELRKICPDTSDGFDSQPPKEMAKEVLPQVEGWLREGLRPPPQKHPSLPALGACANCGVSGESEGVKLIWYRRCKAVKYHSKACQAKHWKEGGHKVQCKILKAK